MKNLPTYTDYINESKKLSNDDLNLLSQEYLKYSPVKFDTCSDIHDCTNVSQNFIMYILKNHITLKNDFETIGAEIGKKYYQPMMTGIHMAVLYKPTKMVIDLTFGQFDKKIKYRITTLKEFEKHFDTKNFDYDGYTSGQLYKSTDYKD